MNPVAFGLAYVGSWLLMGLGIFLAFRVAWDLRRVHQARAVAAKSTVAPARVVIALVALVALVAVGVVYAGAYTFYNLMIVG